MTVFCYRIRIHTLQMIILIRHAQSEGNSESQTLNNHLSKFTPNCHLPQIENRDIHQTVPDHRVKLTPDGWKQVRSRRRPKSEVPNHSSDQTLTSYTPRQLKRASSYALSCAPLTPSISSPPLIAALVKLQRGSSMP